MRQARQKNDRHLGPLRTREQETPFVGVNGKIDHLRPGNDKFNDQFLELHDQEVLNC